MIDDRFTNSTDQKSQDLQESDNTEISKSQRKRDADAIRDLGQQLAELGPSELATIPLPDDVMLAISQLGKLKANGARKRQLGFLAKRLRQADTAPILAALQQLQHKARANTLNHHLVEHWRDRLLGDVDNQAPGEALTQFLNQYNTADRQQLRQLQRQALKERTMQRPPAAARQLFRVIRITINATDEE